MIGKVTKLRSLVLYRTVYIHIGGGFKAPPQSILPNRVKNSNPITTATRIGTIWKPIEYQLVRYESCRRHKMSWDTWYHESIRTIRQQDVMKTYTSKSVRDTSSSNTSLATHLLILRGSLQYLRFSWSEYILTLCCVPASR